MVLAIGSGILIAATGGLATPVVANAATAATVATTTATAGAAASGAVAATTATTVTTATILTGPIGWAVLGASEYTWDCWKPILHHTDDSPSPGIFLRDLMVRPEVTSCFSDGNDFIVTNIWDESFRLQPVLLPEYGLAYHASKL